MPNTITKDCTLGDRLKSFFSYLIFWRDDRVSEALEKSDQECHRLSHMRELKDEQSCEPTDEESRTSGSFSAAPSHLLAVRTKSSQDLVLPRQKSPTLTDMKMHWITPTKPQENEHHGQAQQPQSQPQPQPDSRSEFYQALTRDTMNPHGLEQFLGRAPGPDYFEQIDESKQVP